MCCNRSVSIVHTAYFLFHAMDYSICLLFSSEPFFGLVWCVFDVVCSTFNLYTGHKMERTWKQRIYRVEGITYVHQLWMTKYTCVRKCTLHANMIVDKVRWWVSAHTKQIRREGGGSRRWRWVEKGIFSKFSFFTWNARGLTSRESHKLSKWNVMSPVGSSAPFNRLQSPHTAIQCNNHNINSINKSITVYFALSTSSTPYIHT